MLHNPAIWCHPQGSGSFLSAVPLKVSSSCHLRDIFLTIVTSGLLIIDLDLYQDLCKADLWQCLLLKALFKWNWIELKMYVFYTFFWGGIHSGEQASQKRRIERENCQSKSFAVGVWGKILQQESDIASCNVRNYCEAICRFFSDISLALKAYE